MKWRVTPRVSLIGAGGVYGQPPDPADLSAVFGNPTLSPSSAQHLALGPSLRLTDSLRADATAFAKWMSDLAVRSPLATPKLAQALLPDGSGRSYGLQVLVRQERWHGLSGWVSYTISRSERTTAAGGWRLFASEEPHVLSVVANQRVGPWTFGARLRVASGLPRTLVVRAFFDAAENSVRPALRSAEARHGCRPSGGVDERVDRPPASWEAHTVDAYLEALNLTNHPRTARSTSTAPTTRSRGPCWRSAGRGRQRPRPDL